MSEHEMPRTSKPQKVVSLVRIAKMLLLFACIGAVATLAVWIWYLDQPDSVIVKGRVTLNGQPVTVGVVMAQHPDYADFTPMGEMDKDGNFELLTNMQPGVRVGIYKVRVASFTNGMPPIPLVPSVYTDFATSPLIMTVTDDSSANFFELELKGELPTPRAASPPASPKSPVDDGLKVNDGTPEPESSQPELN